MLKEDENRNCKIHGYTLFKCIKNRKGVWFGCQKCRRLQAVKASAKRRKMPEVVEYQRNYQKLSRKIQKSLSVYLTMILLAAKIKPE